jgi:hypothetical protein
MEYNGYRYYIDEDRDDDCIKKIHYVVTPENETIMWAFSPYSVPSRSMFVAWVDAGCPSRFSRDDYSYNLMNSDLERVKGWVNV